MAISTALLLCFVFFCFPIFLAFFFVAFFLSFPRILGVPRREKPLFFSGLPFFLVEKKARVGGSGLTCLANPLTPTGVKIPKIGKEGSEVKKLAFPIDPEKGASSPKIPISLQGSTRRNGDFVTQSALF